MRFGKVYLAVAAASLMTAPVLAQAAPAAKNSQSSTVKRANADRKAESKIGGGTGIFVALLAAAAVIAGIVVAADGGNNSPTSP